MFCIIELFTAIWLKKNVKLLPPPLGKAVLKNSVKAAEWEGIYDKQM